MEQILHPQARGCVSWVVTNFRPVRGNGNEVIINTVTERGIDMPYPVCGKICKVHDRPVRRWYDFDLGGEPCYIEAEVPRTDCPDCGIHHM